MSELKTTIESAVKDAMRARDRARLATLRLVTRFGASRSMGGSSSMTRACLPS